MDHRLFSSASLSLVRDIPLVQKIGVMTAVELHLNARFYAQHLAMKSVYDKSQSVMSGKLFYFDRVVFELAQGLRDYKQVN